MNRHGGQDMALTKYRNDMPALVEQYAREGLIEREMAAKLGVSVETFEQYKKRYPVFLESLKAGKEIVDREVEQALYKRALGFEYEEVKTTTTTDPETGEERAAIVTKTRKVMAPDVQAQQFWLKNRRPDIWRDSIRIETVDINQALKDAAKLSDAEKRIKLIETDYSISESE